MKPGSTGRARLPAFALVALAPWVAAAAPRQESGAERDQPWRGVLDHLKLYGDFRFRLEGDFGRDPGGDRRRQRIRLRLGANYEISDEVLVGARVVTGNPRDPNSSKVTLGRGFEDIEISLDRAFLTYYPEWSHGSFGTLGKFNNPIVRNPVYGELVWDADIQPEGAVVGHRFDDVGRLRQARFVFGLYAYQEQGNGPNTLIGVGQASTGVQLADSLVASGTIGYYHYTDVSNPATVLRNRGNALVDTSGDGTPDAYASDFGILNPIVALESRLGQAPLRFSAEYVRNVRAGIDADDGWVLGASYGGTARKGDWWAYFQVQDLGQDAVFSPNAQDDFLLSTNFSGTVAGINHQLSDKVGINLWSLIAARNQATAAGGTGDQWRFRLDLNVKL